jgi:hypothetical protein
MRMVKYWKQNDYVEAKVTTNKEGATIMIMNGEDEPFPGFPRGRLLFGTLSKIKHEIKNQLFNESWRKLEEGEPVEKVVQDFKDSLLKIFEIGEVARYDMSPPTKMVKSVKEVWRAMTVLEDRSPVIKPLKEILTYILQEDDAYRFRVQWMVSIFNPNSWWCTDPIKDFTIALEEMENAEIVQDMKGRIRLLKRILLCILEDKRIRELFLALCKEMNWNKLKLDKADLYHFRGKYFKADWIYFEY